jgi:putative ABC transport system ATP-binding protein
MSAIVMEEICKNYTLPSGVTVEILKSIDLIVNKGEFVSIMGPSGSGKSSLMNLLGALDKPTSGVYLLNDEDVGSCNDKTLAYVRNRTIGFVFQGFNLLPRRTVLDNIMLPLIYGGEEPKERIRRAEYYLEKVGLFSHRNHYPYQLSGGQQQRIAIARALAGEPDIILADEPTGNLDSHTGKEIMALFNQLNDDGITIILVTHDENVSRYAKRLVQLRDGIIVYDGPMY